MTLLTQSERADRFYGAGDLRAKLKAFIGKHKITVDDVEYVIREMQTEAARTHTPPQRDT